MQRFKSQRGAALILVIGITAALAVLAATAVLVTVNTQHATADTRAHATALDYAEAALNSGVLAVTTQPWPATGGSFSDSELKAIYDYPSGPGANVVTYDNQNPVNKSIKVDPSTGGDGKVWVEAWVTYNGQTARVREMVGQKNSTVPFSYPKSAVYSDNNVIFDKGVGNVFAINADGSLDTSKTIGVYAGGNVTGNNSSSTFNPVGGGLATVSVNYNGTYTNNAPVNSPTLVHGGVPALNTVVTPANVTTMTTLAQAGNPTQAIASGTVVAAATISGNATYGGANGVSAGDVVVNGDLTMGPGTRYFHSLYVTGNLTQNGGGTFNASALYVGKTLTITSTSGTCQIGPTWVGQDFVIGGGPLSIKTTDWTGGAAYGTKPGPLYIVGNLSEPGGGAYTHVWGPTYVGGNVTFQGNSSQILCPLMVTPGVVTTGGSGSFGTVAQPMVLLGLAGSTSHTMQFSSDATFTGVVINMAGGVNLNNDGNQQPPNNYPFFVDGAVMATGTVEFTNNANVGYNPTVMANAASQLPSQIGTTTTSVLSGTWQQLSPNGQ